MSCKLNISQEEMQNIRGLIINFEPKFRTLLAQRRTHRKWRINKKWAKRYGYNEIKEPHPEYKRYVFEILDDLFSNRVSFDYNNFVHMNDFTLGEPVAYSPPFYIDERKYIWD